jgi:hypothetical protein
MIDTEFLQSYSYIRSTFLEGLDEANTQRGPVPMEYMIALFISEITSKGVSIHIANYFVKEWSKLHPEAFIDSDR